MCARVYALWPMLCVGGNRGHMKSRKNIQRCCNRRAVHHNLLVCFVLRTVARQRSLVIGAYYHFYCHNRFRKSEMISQMGIEQKNAVVRETVL